jgi:hypothetical protein
LPIISNNLKALEGNSRQAPHFGNDLQPYYGKEIHLANNWLVDVDAYLVALGVKEYHFSNLLWRHIPILAL